MPRFFVQAEDGIRDFCLSRGLGGSLEIGQLLVTPNVQGAKGNRPPVQCRYHPPVETELLFFGRELGALHVEEFRAQQSHTVTAFDLKSIQIEDTLQVDLDPNGVTIRCDRRLVRMRLELKLPSLPSLALTQECVDSCPIGPHVNRSQRATHNDLQVLLQACN